MALSRGNLLSQIFLSSFTCKGTDINWQAYSFCCQWCSWSSWMLCPKGLAGVSHISWDPLSWVSWIWLNGRHWRRSKARGGWGQRAPPTLTLCSAHGFGNGCVAVWSQPLPGALLHKSSSHRAWGMAETSPVASFERPQLPCFPYPALSPVNLPSSNSLPISMQLSVLPATTLEDVVPLLKGQQAK